MLNSGEILVVINAKMRPCLTTAAIVLRSRPFGESDKIASFLTENQGKVTGIAKGAKNSRRRFVNSLEPFAQVALSYQDRPHGSLAFLLSAELTVVYKQLPQSLDRISCAAYLVEITDGIVADREENRAIFDHLRRGLCHLDEQDASLRFITSYELELLRMAGYQPVLHCCKTCRVPTETPTRLWFFSLLEGGVLCADCAGPRRHDGLLPLDAITAKVLTQVQQEQNLPMAPIMIPAQVVREVRTIVSSFVQHHIGRELKSAPFLSGFPTSKLRIQQG